MISSAPQSISRRWWRQLPRWRRAVSDGERCAPGLSFHRAPGPLLAVAGLTGGAGASVLAYLIAATAARESSAPVLAADTGGPTSGLARIADATAPLTLCDIAERVTAGEPLPTPLWAHGEHQLRVIAGVPQFTVDAPQETVLRVLGDARHAHGLTIVDVGTLARRAEQAALAAATHVAWTLVANSDALAAARRVLERIVPLSRPELIVARTDPAGAKPPIRELCELAEQRRAPLVLMPTFSDTAAAAAAGGGGVCEASSDELAERAQVALQAIAGVLRR